MTEEFDWRPSRAAFVLKVTKTPAKNAASIEATLDRLADTFPDDA